MRLAGIDFTGLAIIGGVGILAYAGYRLYDSTANLGKKIGAKIDAAGTAIVAASPVPFSAAAARSLYDPANGQFDMVAPTAIDPVTLLGTASIDVYKNYADQNPGVATPSGMNFSYF